MKLKWRRFETVSNIQWESQALLVSIKQNDFRCAFEAWEKNYRIAVYIPKTTILKEMAAKIEQVKLAFLSFTWSGNFPIHLVFLYETGNS
jgi:hypothetical protein